MKTIIFFMSLLTGVIYSQSYALIVGVNNYGLEGAKNDAVALNKLLKAKKVKTKLLVNDQATKRKILQELDLVIEKLNKGDRFYFFFSGHGTSLFDPLVQKIKNNKELLLLLENSGGVVPWDFNEKNIYETLIFSKRDLAPRFKKIDKKVSVAMIMIDACFSGKAHKDFSRNKHKQLRLPINTKLHFNTNIYFYKNLLYLSSTTVSDWALEDKTHKPYRGFFSRALENCLAVKNRLNSLKSCLKNKKMAQSSVIYSPKIFNSTLFEVGADKSIIRASKEEEEIDYRDIMVVEKDKFNMEIFTVQENGIEKRVYTPNESVLLKISSNKEGYLVLFSVGASGKLDLIYPKFKDKKINIGIEELTELELDGSADNSHFGDEFISAYLVNQEVSHKFIEIYKKNIGEFPPNSSIREVKQLLQGFEGSSLRLFSKKD